jgi:hypothetical protein
MEQFSSISTIRRDAGKSVLPFAAAQNRCPSAPKGM